MGPVATYAYERQLSLLCHEWPKAKTSSSVKRGECEKEISTVELDKLKEMQNRWMGGRLGNVCNFVLAYEIITQKMFPLFV